MRAAAVVVSVESWREVEVVVVVVSTLWSAVVVAAEGEDVGTLPAAVPAAVALEEGEEEGAPKNDVMLFCFCFLPVEAAAAAGIEPGSLRLRGVDILYLYSRSLSLSLFPFLSPLDTCLFLGE